ELGYCDALLARELYDGSLELVDGHLRAAETPDSEVPVLVLDITAEEADKLLAILDPLAALAETDKGKLEAVLKSVSTDDVAVRQLLEDLAVDNGLNALLEGQVDPDQI